MEVRSRLAASWAGARARARKRETEEGEENKQRSTCWWVVVAYGLDESWQVLLVQD